MIWMARLCHWLRRGQECEIVSNDYHGERKNIGLDALAQIPAPRTSIQVGLSTIVFPVAILIWLMFGDY